LDSFLLPERDIALFTDFYELSMAAAYFNSGQKDTIGLFEMFVRKLPKNRSYLVAAGLEQVIYFLINFRFKHDHIEYLRNHKVFSNISDRFFEYLSELKFTGNLWAIPEGSIVFSNEPILRIEAPIIEAQLVETYLLSVINFQTLIASKASRIVEAAKGRSVIEFGSRRAHGPNAGILGARASIIGGCQGTSNTYAGYKIGIPASGTMAHSFVMNFASEEEAFQAFCDTFPESTLLVDTYDPIKAVKIALQKGLKFEGVRIDSGDILSISKEIRMMLDDAGRKSAKIMATGDLNEHIIYQMVSKQAPIDYFGVGTELSTSRDDPALNGVYKLVGIRIKSNNLKGNKYQTIYKRKKSPGKENFPGPKQVHRLIRNNRLVADILTLANEEVRDSIPMLKQYIKSGRVIERMPSISEIRSLCRNQVSILPEQFRRLDYVPEASPVVISEKLRMTSNMTSNISY
jgi:nicotinate phosphoribosyltransferase